MYENNSIFQLVLTAVVFYLTGYIFVHICGYYGITEIISMAAVNALFVSILISLVIVSMVVILLCGFIVMFFGTDEQPPEE